MIDAMRLGHLDQVALITPRPGLDVHVLAGIDVRLYPERGLDVGAAWFRGLPLAWISPVGEGGAEATVWGEAWGGGLVTTCGSRILETGGIARLPKGIPHALRNPSTPPPRSTTGGTRPTGPAPSRSASGSTSARRTPA